MSSLTSLLVRDQRVTVRKIEEAIQRQVIVGGGLDTVLLELGVVPEDVMAAYCAAVYGLLPATRDEVMRVPRDSIRIVPREVAERHRLVPLVLENGTLVVAVVAPLEASVEEQLGFLLGVELVQRIVVEARLAAALNHHYGVEMSPRMRRLTEKLRQRDPGVVPFVAPPEPNLVERESMTGYEAAPDDDDDDDEGEEGPSTRPFGIVAATPVTSTDSNEAAVRVGVAQVVGVRYGSRPPPAATDVARPVSVPPPAAVPVERVRAERKPREGASDPGRVSVPKSELLRKHRGPLTARRAVQLLGEAPDRDTILEIGFAFARQFFDTTALFVVHEDSAEAIDIVGPGVPFDDARRPGVSLDEPGAFALVREGVVPLVTHLDQSEADRGLRADLGRDEAMPAVLVPIAIRQRVVLVLYGDRGGDDFGLADVPELLGFAPRLSEAFQKLILRLKRGPAPESAPPSDAPLARPSAPPKRWSTPPPEDSRWSTPPASSSLPPSPEPVPSAVPAAESAVEAPVSEPPVSEISAARRRRPRKRSEAFEVLGVPREAPPPPVPGAMPEVVARPSSSSTPRPDVVVEPEVVVGVPAEVPTEDAEASSPSIGVPIGDEPRPRDTLEIAPPPEALEVPAESVDDDEPDIEVSEATSDEIALLEEAVAPRRKKRAEPGTYRMRGGVEEVVFSPRRKDPRRADSEPDSPEPEVVRLEGITPVASRATLAPSSTPPPRPSGLPGELPSVIVEMDESVEALVGDLRLVGPEDEGNAVTAVVALGEVALPVLVRDFPGPLWFDRHRPHRRLPRGRDVSAVSRAIVAFGDRAVPYVASLLDRDDVEVRFYATLLASELPHRDLVGPLGRRVFDDDGKVAVLALDVLSTLRGYDDELAEVLQLLRATARVPRYPAERRARATHALGELRDVDALELCVALLEAHEDVLADAAHEALVTLTRQDFGSDPDRWDPWVEANKGRHRIEWLIDGLLHADEELRRAAGEELKHLTQEYYGYHPALPKRDREVAQRKYRRWWETEGHQRFAS
ncbi:MAG: hypothetical protein H6720_24680 [Sandaracinus sp.]|nr:hypothetical protein [Sandaracinus sp.]